MYDEADYEWLLEKPEENPDDRYRRNRFILGRLITEPIYFSSSKIATFKMEQLIPVEGPPPTEENPVKVTKFIAPQVEHQRIHIVEANFVVGRVIPQLKDKGRLHYPFIISWLNPQAIDGDLSSHRTVNVARPYRE